MHQSPSSSYELALRDFQRARKSAVLRQLLARLRGKSTDLLDYETICQQLGPTNRTIAHGLKEIPLAKIVGSVGRYRDFTREFLPTQQANATRWATIKAAVTDMTGLPPIEVYQIGDAYFVLDGNHRVSVARKLGSKTISAHVTEVKTRVPLSAADDPDEVICKARYANFLAQTNLDQNVPDADLLMTVAGHYQTLFEQINLHHQLLLSASQSEPNTGALSPSKIDFEAAALSWYESVYLPVVKIIRHLGVMRRFPRRSETDIYVLLSNRREQLEQDLQWNLLLEDIPTLIDDASLIEPSGDSISYVSKLVDSIMPEALDGVKVGGWRTQQLAMERTERLFSDLLVMFEGIDEDWDLLEIAIRLGAKDHDRILGLCIVDQVDQMERTFVREMQARFNRRCKSAGLVGEFAVEAGDAAPIMLKRAAWSDLVLINLTHPPESTVLDRLRSFWGPLITRCPRPLLIVPHAKHNGMNPMLLAYDGSPKADEALFVAAYQASRWGHALTVLTVETQQTKPSALRDARTYLEEHDVHHANYILKSAPIGEAILETAAEEGSNTIIMGGFGARPVVHLLRGSAVEYVLQHAVDQAVLICQ